MRSGQLQKKEKADRTDAFLYSNHGYHANDAEMHAFFMALGPSFRAMDQKMGSFVNLEIHNLVMDLLSIPEVDRASNNVSEIDSIRAPANALLLQGTYGFWHPYLQKR